MGSPQVVRQGSPQVVRLSSPQVVRQGSPQAGAQMMKIGSNLGCLCLLFLSLLFFAFAAPGAEAAGLDCQKLSTLECFAAKGCFLDCGTADKKRCEPYHCRRAAGSCEETYAQHDLTKEKCEALPGCKFEPAFCFCPGPMECFCGGGPPSRCKKE